MRINFGQLVRIEPKLLDLLNEAAMLDKKGKTYAQLNTIWYRDFKPRMANLVGMYVDTGSDFIKSSEAYGCAYETICSCLTGEPF